MSKDKAIVLRRRFHCYTLLSKNNGIFDAYLAHISQGMIVSPGMIISYVHDIQRGQRFWVRDYCIEQSPLLFGRDDIVFLHALLELVACYGTIADIHAELFSFFEQLCNRSSYVFSSFVKKIVVCVLFTQLGLFPDQTDLFDYHFFLSFSIDKIDTIDLQLVDESFLERWIAWNITHYPQGRWVKVLPQVLEK